MSLKPSSRSRAAPPAGSAAVRAPAKVVPIPKASFRDKQFALREEAILDAVNGLLSTRGYELMVLDDVAAEVGIAKGSLYKHFESKEALAGAAMKRLLHRLVDQANALVAQQSLNPIEKLRALLRWALHERLAGRLPTLPSTNKSLVASLSGDKTYVAALSDLAEAVGGLIEEAISAKLINSTLPVPVVMLSIYAKSCDPSFDYLRSMGGWTDEQVVDYMVGLCFDGLRA